MSELEQARRNACEILAARLRLSHAEAHAVARSLAPDGAGPGQRFIEPDGKRVAYQQRFKDIDGLLSLLTDAHSGALVFALEILAELDPEAGVPVAELLLPGQPKNDLGSALSRVLGRCRSERSFRLLMDFPQVPYLRGGLAQNGWAGGVDEAWTRLKQVDFDAADLDPHVRVQTLPLVSYLLHHDRARALTTAEALLSTRHANLGVAHALHRLPPEGPEMLLRDLAAARGASLTFSQRLGVKVLLERDPSTVVSNLGGQKFLGTPEGRPRLRALIEWLRSDTWAKPFEGGSRGWLAADPRFAQLMMALKGDPERELAALCRDLLATLPKDERPKSARGTAKKSVPVQIAPDDALLKELAQMRACLERLIAHLRGTDYRFAAPKEALAPPKKSDLSALARLEKKMVVPPVLGAIWKTIGSVDLRGQHPSWPCAAYLGFAESREPVWLTDPLVIAPARQVIGDALEEASEPPFALRLAPDSVGKAAYSGGTLTVWLPSEAADPALEGAGETLLEHLRRAIAWGGFPGFASIEQRPQPWIDEACAVCR